MLTFILLSLLIFPGWRGVAGGGGGGGLSMMNINITGTGPIYIYILDPRREMVL